MNTFAETEALLRTAIILSDNSIKQIAVESGIKANTLYNWKTTDVHLSPAKSDALLTYFTLTFLVYTMMMAPLMMNMHMFWT